MSSSASGLKPGKLRFILASTCENDGSMRSNLSYLVRGVVFFGRLRVLLPAGFGRGHSALLPLAGLRLSWERVAFDRPLSQVSCSRSLLGSTLRGLTADARRPPFHWWTRRVGRNNNERRLVGSSVFGKFGWWAPWLSGFPFPPVPGPLWFPLVALFVGTVKGVAPWLSEF